MTPDKLREAFRESQQLLADIPVQLAAIGIRRQLQTGRFAALRGFTAVLRLRPVVALNATIVAPAVPRSARPTSHPLAVRAALGLPFLCRTTPSDSAPVLARGTVRIPGRIRSG